MTRARSFPGRATVAAAVAAAWMAAGSARADEVTVFAAASLSDAVTEIGHAFESSSGHKVAFNFGASSDLGRQIRAGAPADVFFSADEVQMDAVQEAGFVRASDRTEVLSNTLVVVVPAGPPRPLRGPEEIAGFERLALADPEAVPAGVYARQYLQSLGLWDRLADRVVPTLNVRAALAAVESGNAPAAIVYRTDATISKRVQIAFEVPRLKGPRIVYVMAPLVGASPAGRALAAALRSPEAARVYEKYGFLVLLHP